MAAPFSLPTVGVYSMSPCVLLIQLSGHALEGLFHLHPTPSFPRGCSSAVHPAHVSRYEVGDCRVAVVHGDADAFAGWRFDVRHLAQAIQGHAAFEVTQARWLQTAHTGFTVAQALLAPGSPTKYPG